MISSFKKVRHNQKPRQRGQASEAMIINQLVIKKSEFLCFMNGKVFLIASHKVLVEKLQQQSSMVLSGITVLFTYLAQFIALCHKSAAYCFHISYLQKTLHDVSYNLVLSNFFSPMFSESEKHIRQLILIPTRGRSGALLQHFHTTSSLILSLVSVFLLVTQYSHFTLCHVVSNLANKHKNPYKADVVCIALSPLVKIIKCSSSILP